MLRNLAIISAAVLSSVSFAGSLHNSIDEFGHTVYCQALIMNDGEVHSQQVTGALYQNGLEYYIPGYCEDPHCQEKKFITPISSHDIEEACKKGLSRNLNHIQIATNLLSTELPLVQGAVTRTFVIVDGHKLDISAAKE